MKLTAKLVALLMVGIVAVTVINGYLSVQREINRFKAEAEQDAEQMGVAMEEMITVVWRESGRERALRMMRKSSEDHPQTHVRWVWFDARPGDPFSPALPSEQLRSIVVGRIVSFESQTPAGESRLHSYWPVRLDESQPGGLEFSQPTTDLEAEKSRIITRTLWQLGALFAVTGLLATLLGIRLIGRPLEKLTAKTRRVATGDLTEPVELDSHDELAELGDSLNLMCDRLADTEQQVREESAARIAAMEQLRHADRLKTVGRLASGVAHELGTPLGVVSGRAGLIASGKLSADEVTSSAKVIQSESERMTSIIRHLLDFARRSAPQRTSVRLSSVIEQTVDLLEALAQKNRVEIEFTPPEVPCISLVDAGQLQQVLTNLIVNAIQAMPDGGRVRVRLWPTQARPPGDANAATGDYALIRIEDNGVGIDEETLPHLFEPFFTTKGVGEGTGLGLSIAYGIVQEHDGWIDVASTPGKGSCFALYLPQESES
jgi:signal transduction histidine kinase